MVNKIYLEYKETQLNHFKHLALILALIPQVGFAQDQAPGAHFIENWNSDDDGMVSLDEITARRADVFFMFDIDESGDLSAEEYQLFDETRAADMQNGGHLMGKGADRVQEGLTLAFNDSNGDGVVSADEFAAKSADWFAMIDRDGDGMITSKDFGPQNK